MTPPPSWFTQSLFTNQLLQCESLSIEIHQLQFNSFEELLLAQRWLGWLSGNRTSDSSGGGCWCGSCTTCIEYGSEFVSLTRWLLQLVRSIARGARHGRKEGRKGVELEEIQRCA